MNDYKELIEELRAHCLCITNGDNCDNCEGLISEKAYCHLQIELHKKAADAIEQLVAKLKRATLRGEWQEVTLDRSIGKVKGFMCSKCGYEKIGRISKPNYCPECGAKMFGDEQ